MCQAFSCIVDIEKKVTWKFGLDSHTELVKIGGYKDQTSDPALMTFARIEITPDNRSYLKPDNWSLRVDESITPAWLTPQHKEAAFSAHKKWLRKLNTIIIRKDIVHPFQIDPPAITEKHVALLKKWDSVRDSVGASVGTSVGDSVWASVRASGWDSVRASVWASVRDSVRDSVGASVWASVRDSVWESVGASVWDSVGASVWDSVRDSVWDSVWAYQGSFFKIPKWKYVKHVRGKYPYESLVKLWNQGLVPSFDGTTWRLHGKNAKVLFQITKEKLSGKRESWEGERGDAQR